MPIFERPPLETLPSERERWTPLYLEYGRLEVDDSSVKWIQSDGLVCAIPVATISAIILGPGTSVTHAAVLACAESNTSIIWGSQNALRFKAWGSNTSADNANARKQALAYGNRNVRTSIARKMFAMRFGEEEAIADKSINELRGMEGIRWRKLYYDISAKYGVEWSKRKYDKNNWDGADAINRAISAANASLHALCNAVICGMGYLPQIGFLHDDSAISFACDIADLFKAKTTLPAAFSTVGMLESGNDMGEDSLEDKVLDRLNLYYEEVSIMKRIPLAIEFLFKNL